MSFATALFTSIVLLLPITGALETGRDVQPEEHTPIAAGASLPGDTPLSLHLVVPAPMDGGETGPLAAWPFRQMAESFRAEAADQVRIEQRMTIRITPLPSPMRPNMLMDLPSREIGPRFTERKMGKCLPVSGITGVQLNGKNRLILFMRDQRIISAELERTCRARDFYSGFYLARSADGKLCVDRDTLLSRNGANCKLSRIRELVEIDD